MQYLLLSLMFLTPHAMAGVVTTCDSLRSAYGQNACCNNNSPGNEGCVEWKQLSRQAKCCDGGAITAEEAATIEYAQAAYVSVNEALQHFSHPTIPAEYSLQFDQLQVDDEIVGSFYGNEMDELGNSGHESQFHFNADGNGMFSEYMLVDATTQAYAWVEYFPVQAHSITRLDNKIVVLAHASGAFITEHINEYVANNNPGQTALDSIKTFTVIMVYDVGDPDPTKHTLSWLMAHSGIVLHNGDSALLEGVYASPKYAYNYNDGSDDNYGIREAVSKMDPTKVYTRAGLVARTGETMNAADLGLVMTIGV